MDCFSSISRKTVDKEKKKKKKKLRTYPHVEYEFANQDEMYRSYSPTEQLWNTHEIKYDVFQTIQEEYNVNQNKKHINKINKYEKHPILFIHLPHIYEKLTLGNYDYASTVCYGGIYDHIINLSCRLFPEGHSRKITHNILLHDNKTQHYDNFKKAIMWCVQIIRRAKEKRESVLVNCLAGVNRSCSAIVAFDILENGRSIEESIEYICRVKQEHHDDYIEACMGTIETGIWDTMNNESFVNHLYLLKSEIENQ